MVERRGVVRARDAAVAAIAAVVAFLLPTLTTLDGTTTLTGALLAVALAALLHTAHEATHLAGRTTSGPVGNRRDVPLVLTTRTTDPTHHPRRPRAPGTV